MRNMKFDVQKYPSKETAGVTIVRDEFVGEDGATTSVTLGELRKSRGDAGYTAFVNDRNGGLVQLDGTHSTRSKGGHALRAAYEATERAERTAARAAAKAAKTSKRASKSESDLGGEAA